MRATGLTRVSGQRGLSVAKTVEGDLRNALRKFYDLFYPVRGEIIALARNLDLGQRRR